MRGNRVTSDFSSIEVFLRLGAVSTFRNFDDTMGSFQMSRSVDTDTAIYHTLEYLCAYLRILRLLQSEEQKKFDLVKVYQLQRSLRVSSKQTSIPFECTILNEVDASGQFSGFIRSFPIRYLLLD